MYRTINDNYANATRAVYPVSVAALTIGPGDPVRLPSHGPESIQVAFVTGPFERTYVKIKATNIDPF